MIKRSTWATVIVFIVFLAFAWYWSRSKTQETTVPTPGPDALWQSLSSEVESFTVENLTSGEQLQLQRDPEFGWVLVSPIEGPANSAKAEEAASWLANPVPTRLLTSGQNLNQYGLDQPRFRISVRLDGDERHELEIGNDTPTGNSTYVLVPGNPNVFVVNRFSVESVINLVAEELLVTPTPEVEPTETVDS